MPRIRSIHPGAPLDEDVATMSLAARYVWAYLPCHADREGRLKDSAFTLKAAILPGDASVDMEAVLAELAERGHIIRYQAAGKRCIQIRNFLRYQAPHSREVSSTIPAMETKEVAEHVLGSASAQPRQTDGAGLPSSPDQIRSGPVSIPSPGSGSPDQTRPRSNDGAALAPFHVRPAISVGAVTEAFLAVYDAYPRKDAKQAAAQVFQELALDYPGGENALSAEILAAFSAGMLKRHPYQGPNHTRPFLDKVLAERRWEDLPSAPDDETRAEPFAVRAEKGREEHLLDGKVARIVDDLKPKAPPPSPRQEFLDRERERKLAGGAA